jgi:DNA-binding NarL/FixJ family response regulator
MIRLLLADDHAIVRSGLAQIFSLLPDIEVLGEARNGAELLAALRQHSALDLILLDLNMEGVSGADLIARIKAQRPGLPILVLSMHNEPQAATRMLRAGANGYITKDCNPDVLLVAMRRVAAGGKYIVPALAEKMGSMSTPTRSSRCTACSRTANARCCACSPGAWGSRK